MTDEPTAGLGWTPSHDNGVAPVERHTARISSVPRADVDDPEFDEVRTSWLRSADRNVDAEGAEAPRILSAGEIRFFLEPWQEVVRIAQPELNRLYAIVRHFRYAVFLCDPHGIAIDHRGADQSSREFRNCGVCLGAVWPEELEGTNGVGTCIAEQRPVLVHQTQHFRMRHASLSCSGAPIFDPAGQLAAVLELSCIDPRTSARSHGLTLPLVSASARTIEEQLFRQRFLRHRVITIAPPDEDASALLLAIDADHRIVGANRCARAEWGISEERLLAGLSLWTIFERNGSLLHRSDHGVDKLVSLTRPGEAESVRALVSAPLSPLRTRLNPEWAGFLTRPRIPLSAELCRDFAPQPPRGGLSPGALRRVCRDRRRNGALARAGKKRGGLDSPRNFP
jgi:transcriptional regulator of acetoin/glycerol metabolism